MELLDGRLPAFQAAPQPPVTQTDQEHIKGGYRRSCSEYNKIITKQENYIHE